MKYKDGVKEEADWDRMFDELNFEVFLVIIMDCDKPIFSI